MEASNILRSLLLLTVGLPYLAIKGLAWFTRRAWQAIVIHRGLQILLSLLVLFLCLATWKFGPLVTGRLALQSSAETLARGAGERNTLDVENALRRRAYRLGFRTAITEPFAVSVERSEINGITLCTISYEFHREVDLFGFWRMRIPVSGRVEEPVEPPGEKGRGLEEILVQ